MIASGFPFEIELILMLVILTFAFVVNFIGLKRKGIFSKLFRLIRKKEEASNLNPVSEASRPVLYAKFKTFLRLKIPKIINLLSSAKQKFSPILKYKLIIFNIVTIPVLFWFSYDLIHAAGIKDQYPLYEATLKSYDDPIYIEFDRPYSAESIQPYIFPEVDGEWKAVPVYKWLPFVKRKLEFHPYETMFPGKVFVYFAEITDVFKLTDTWEYAIDAYSVPIPNVTSITPTNKTKDFPVDGDIMVQLDIPAARTLLWKLRVAPHAEYSVDYSQPDKIALKFDKPLLQNTKYTFKLFRVPVRYRIDTFEVVEQQEKELVKQVTFKTVKAPFINGYAPKGDLVDVDQNIKIFFDTPMVAESAQAKFKIKPNVEGSFIWEDEGKTLVFDPKENLAKETTYTAVLFKGVKNQKGGFTESKAVHTFTTIGAVKVSGFSPSSSAARRNSNIVVYFNQPVDKASAQSKFSISPSVPGNFSWSGNAMTFNPDSDLAFSTTYRITIAAGVKTVKGLDSRSTFSHSFTTEREVFILNVPVIYQSLRYECNLVAARMAISYKGGGNHSTMTLYGQIAKDNTPWDPNNNTWGNPHVGYVGDIYGSSKGYGVYWNPLAAVVDNYRSVAVRTGWNRTAALQEVRNGNPVIIWAHNGYSGSGANISWHTPGGTYIHAIQGMHSYVLKGWEGPIDNPTYIWLNDPNRGSYRVSTGYFDALWGYFSRSGVVVY